MPSPPQSDSSLTGESRRMLEAINDLPEDEREAFELVRVQGMSYSEAAEVLDVSLRTAMRWVNRSLRVLTERLSDLRPEDTPPRLLACTKLSRRSRRVPRPARGSSDRRTL